MFDSYTIEPSVDEYTKEQIYAVYAHGEYEETSVLAGQARRVFMDYFDTVELALEEYPEAEVMNHSTKVMGYNAGDTMPVNPPDWFDPTTAGENWGEDY